MKIDIWSDIACPFCYIGFVQLKKAIDKFEHKNEVEVIHHSFLLDPEAPQETQETLYSVLARKKGITVKQAEQMNQQVTEYAASDGLEFHTEKAVPVSSFDGHRLIHFAAKQGMQDEMTHRLFKAYFTDGKSISDHSTLTKLAEEIGLHRSEVELFLKSDEMSNEVQEDLNIAVLYGIRGVPFVVVNDKYTLSGAQGEEIFLKALKNIWEEHL